VAYLNQGYADGFSCDFEYTPSTRRVTGLRVLNNRNDPVWAEAVLTTGLRVGQVFLPHSDTTINIPNNLLKVVDDPVEGTIVSGIETLNIEIPASNRH